MAINKTLQLLRTDAALVNGTYTCPVYMLDLQQHTAHGNEQDTSACANTDAAPGQRSIHASNIAIEAIQPAAARSTWP
jgi:hypothetical protein